MRLGKLAELHHRSEPSSRGARNNLRVVLCLAAMLAVPLQSTPGTRAQPENSQLPIGQTAGTQQGGPERSAANPSQSEGDTYAVRYTKAKARAVEALSDTSVVTELQEQLKQADKPNPSEATPSSPAVALPNPALANAEHQRAQAMLDVVKQGLQVARDKLELAKHASSPVEAMVLAQEAADAADQANHMARALAADRGLTARQTAPPPGAAALPRTFDCSKLLSCQQAISVQKDGKGFDFARSGAPLNSDVLDPRVGNTGFFHSMQATGSPQPGGIKFSGERADDLALMLDVTAVDFDPVHNRLVLIGSRSEHPFDLEVFADVLRLAAEKYEPFFSLEPNNAVAWDENGTFVARLLRDRYGSSAEVADRIRAASPPPVVLGDAKYYYATLAQIDPDLDRQDRQSHDLSVKVIFSPSWLRYSKVGWILYRADLAIKGIASGFVMRGSQVVPSPAWAMADFDPIWLRTHRAGQENGAGRADFELDERSAQATDTGVDLSEVRPKLYVTGRKSGTDEDTAPSDGDRAISLHFTRHWRDYTDQLPELAELEEVYRAYVAAHYLVRNHPGLAEKILQMPVVRTAELPPLYIYHPPVLRAAVRRGEPAPLNPGNDYDIGGGYGGGTEFKLGQIRYETEGSARFGTALGWLRSVSQQADSGEPWIESNGNAAAVLELEGQPPPSRWLVLSGLLFALLVAFGTWISLVLGQHPWQHLTAHPVCDRCTLVHRRLGLWSLVADAAAASALLYLASVPFLLASRTWQARPNGDGEGRLLLMALVAVGWAVAIPLVGAAARVGRKTEVINWLAEFLLGARLLMLATGCLLVVTCAQGSQAASILFLVIGHPLGERMLSSAGGPSAFVPVLAAGSLFALTAALVDLAVPFAMGSRPLPWRTATPHSHSLV
jgi:hypothetical protein